MTPSEFKAWFDGFTLSDDGPPSLAKRNVINERIADIDGFALNEQVFLEVFRNVALDVPFQTEIAGSAAPGMAFDAETAMHALGKMESSSLFLIEG
jgi:hypothetical protein